MFLGTSNIGCLLFPINVEGGGPMEGKINGVFDNTSCYFISHRSFTPQGLKKIHPSTKMGVLSAKC